jgi:hypothetical protein
VAIESLISEKVLRQRNLSVVVGSQAGMDERGKDEGEICPGIFYN